jgi:hypothetical protein
LIDSLEEVQHNVVTLFFRRKLIRNLPVHSPNLPRLQHLEFFLFLASLDLHLGDLM